jgi:hypothetical protein
MSTVINTRYEFDREDAHKAHFVMAWNKHEPKVSFSLGTGISTVISYSTGDSKFIRRSILEAQKFSKRVVVVSCSHRFNGIPEDDTYIKALQRELKFDLINLPWDRNKSPKDWHNMLRHAGYLHTVKWDPLIEENGEYKGVSHCLFLDGDEIVEGDSMLKWLKSLPECPDTPQTYKLLPINAMFPAYFYFLDPTLVSTALEMAGLLISVQYLREHEDAFFNENERSGMMNASLGVIAPLAWPPSYDPEMEFNSQYQFKDWLKGAPFVHHYSWVRSEEEMYKKIIWAHSGGKDWKTLIHNHFKLFDDLNPFCALGEEPGGSRPHKCFVHNYEYFRVPNKFNL